ncbi:filamentous hemagglutinin N-terminal domain-containing protein [Morganella morganii]|uniref:two-partner secretion domain-containing protein n=2 Tax=Enterobacterales TaxID=91347 RepID=UPI001BDA6447|nr:filamentous hemagglutinin N-terminal domain-containing protein [Morganella morganii]ELT0452625.1 filamentous hemagglutinin N-terminal domain-containing protein [Morganella morganii]MBT0335779.1 filamentous hemagglutinin N-terminal domain-containing protein [Morganella morganii subsp. morganii]
MKKTLTALSFISAALFSAVVTAGPGSTEYTYRNGDKIRVASPEAETSLFKDKSGNPVMVINSPDNRGISHNIFTDYNVGKRGLVIHNNENAKTIINEVIGENKTRLFGNTSVAGGKANLVIVNPNGVACYGCSSTNTSLYSHRKTLPVIINAAKNNEVIFDTRKPLHASERLTGISHNISVSSPR